MSGFWNGVASFGLGAQGYNAYNNDQSDRAALEAKRARDTEISNIEMEKLRRQDQLAKDTRAVAAQYGLGGPNQLPATSDTTVSIPQPVTISDEGEPTPLPAADKTVPGLPAATNRTGMFNAIADRMERDGDLQGAANYRAGTKQAQAEGYASLLKGVISSADPDTIKQDFNAQGTHRIVSAQKDGDGYTFQYEDGRTQTMTPQQANDVGMKLGLVKKDLTIVPHDATAIDASGTVVARGKETPKPDPFQLEEFKADLRDRSEKLKASLAKKSEGKPREVALAEAFVNAGVAPDMKEALVMATEGKNLSPERFRATIVQKLAGDMSDRLAGASPDQATKARDQLTRAADEITKIAFPRAGASAAPASGPQQLSGPGSGYTPPATDASAPRKPPPASIGGATFTGNYTRAGKPLYKAADGSLMVSD